MHEHENQEPVDVASGAAGPLKRLALFLAVAVAGGLVSHYTHLGELLTAGSITDFADRLGGRGVAVILLAGAVTPLLFLPRWPIAFLAGLLYGVVWGTLLSTAASTVGAWLHFMLSRTLLSPMSDRLRRRYGLEHLTIPRDKQFMVLFVLRAFPLSSFVATNLIAGALKLSRVRFITASLFGMIPSSLMYASWGKLMKKPDPHFYVLAGVVLALVVVGAVAAQRVIYPWFKAAQNGPPANP